MSASEANAAGAVKPKFRFGHVGVSVANLEEAIAFYTVLFQAEPYLLWDGKDKPYLDQEVGYENSHIRVAYFEMPQGFFEVLEYVNPKPGQADPETYNRGHMHFCFDVEDVEGEYRRLRDADIGIEFRSGDGVAVVPDDDPDWPGLKCFYFRTPDGSTIELAEGHS
jgi:catechol 2,3-dioxygenase-like lactoylglutathione lyase family enzyme